MVGPKEEPTSFPTTVAQEQRMALTLEDREKAHQCTGNCGHFTTGLPDEFSINSYYQYRLARGRRDQVSNVLPASELDITGWNRSNIRRVYRRKPIGKWRT